MANWLPCSGCGPRTHLGLGVKPPAQAQLVGATCRFCAGCGLSSLRAHGTQGHVQVQLCQAAWRRCNGCELRTCLALGVKKPADVQLLVATCLSCAGCSPRSPRAHGTNGLAHLQRYIALRCCSGCRLSHSRVCMSMHGAVHSMSAHSPATISCIGPECIVVGGHPAAAGVGLAAAAWCR